MTLLHHNLTLYSLSATSSVVIYLLTVMVACDVLIVIGRFVPSVISKSVPDLELDDTTCKAFKGISFFGRAGSGLSIVVLAIERNAALRFPNK